MKETVLVTGGAGYIGSHTIRKLNLEGYEVIVFDNFSSGHRDAVKGFTVVEGDLSDQKSIEGAFEKYKPAAVIHFAGSIEAGESVTDPERFFANNLVTSLNLLNVMKNAGVKKIVFSSSAAIYGEPKKNPIVEEDEKIPCNPYGLTKLMFEQILETYDNAYGIKSVCLRYFNAAGADPSGEIGADHKHKTHLITLAILAALGKRDGLKIFGADYDTPDGTCIRDYIHVNDLADAHVLALSYLNKTNHSNQFNLGNEVGESVKEVIQKTKEITGKDFDVEIVGRREGDPSKIVASSKKAKTTLGWNPKLSSLEKILETAYKWHLNNPDGFKE